MRRLPLIAARCGESNPKPGTFWKSVPLGPKLPLGPKFAGLPLNVRPEFRTRVTGTPTREALDIPDGARTIPRPGAGATRGITVAGRRRALEGPPRAWAAASTRMSRRINALIE